MRAEAGDRLHIVGHRADMRDQRGEIIAVRGRDGAPPFPVRFADGRARPVRPQPGDVIEQVHPTP